MGQRQGVRRKAEAWRKIIDEQEASGESVGVYCRKQGLGDKSLYGWRRRLWEKKTGREKGFLKLQRPTGWPEKVLRIETPGGFRVEVPQGLDANFLKVVLEVLDQRR